MIREGQDVRHVGDPPKVSGNPDTPLVSATQKIHMSGRNRSARSLDLEHVSPALSLFAAVQNYTRSAASFLVRSTSLPAAWGLSCTAIYRGAWKARAKPSDQMTGTPTKWSDRSSPISPTHFGLRTLRLRSQRFVAAVFVPLNAISAANENGRVTRSPPSSPKFCVVTPCATSRSFPNGSRRPF